MARDLPSPVPCKGCPASIRWTKTRLGRDIPLEVKPDPHGEWVLVQVTGLGRIAVRFDPAELLHHGLDRWASHLRRCRLPQGQAQQAPPKADPTAGLKFPKQRPPAPRDHRPCVKCRESRAQGKGPCHRCWREGTAAQDGARPLPPFPPLSELEARRHG